MYTATLAIDNILTAQTVNLQAELTARELVEATLIQLQTNQNSDPFKFTIDYFGYDRPRDGDLLLCFGGSSPFDRGIGAF